MGYLWDSHSGRRAQRNIGWNDKGIRLCFPQLTPSSSLSHPQSLMEPLHPWRSSGGPFSVAWAAGGVYVCCVHVSSQPQQELQLALVVCLCAQPCIPCCCGTSLTYHIASWAPDSWFQYPSQQQAHPGGMPPTQHLPPFSSWQQWQHSWETLLLTHIAKCTLGITVTWVCYL